MPDWNLLEWTVYTWPVRNLALYWFLFWVFRRTVVGRWNDRLVRRMCWITPIGSVTLPEPTYLYPDECLAVEEGWG